MTHESLILGAMINGRYRVQSLIGRGHMGVVYGAFDEERAEDVAVKFLTIRGDRKEALRRFFRGARLARAIRHKHIVRTLDFGISEELEGRAFLVMDRVHGFSLTSIDKAHLSVGARVGLVAQLLQALAHMHARNVLHRDIKPDNILVQRALDGALSVRVTDFGLAAGIEFDSEDSLSTAGHVILGTPAYMAPEQGSQIGAPQPSSDLYAVGVVLYEMITGTRPFDGSPIEVIVNKNRFDADSISPTANIPVGLIVVIMKLLERDPSQRYQHAIDVLEALMPYVELPRLMTLPSNAMDVLAPTLDGSEDSDMATLFERVESHDVRRAESDPFLWGREPVFDILEDAVASAIDGMGQIVVMEGGLGMGAGAVMDHMAVRVAETGQCRALRADFIELAGAESGLRQALEGYLGSHGLARDDVGHLIREHLERHSAHTESEYEALVQFLRPTRTGVAFAEGNQNAIFALFFRTLRRMSTERPVFLALSEFHRGETLSAAFLEYAVFELGFEQCPILVCATTETLGPQTALSAALERVREHTPHIVTRVAIGPIERDILAEGLRGQYSIDSDAAYGIADRAGGSPLIAHHLAEIFMTHQGAMDSQSSGSWGSGSWGSGSWGSGGGEASLALSPALSNLLAQSIDGKLRFHPERAFLRQIIEVTAVLGAAVEYNLLVAVVEEDVPSDQIEPLLMQLVQLGILVSDGPSDQERFLLSPPLLRDYYLESMDPERLVGVHGRAIDAYLSLCQEEVGPVSGVLGDHYAGAGQPEKAVQSWLDAFDFQFHHGDPLRAAHWGKKVMDILGTEDARTVECALKTGRLLLDMGELNKAEEVLTPLQTHPDVDVVLRAGEVLSDIYENQGSSTAWKALKIHLDTSVASASPVGERAYLRMRSIFENSYGRARSGLADAVRALEQAPSGEEAQRAAQRAVFCCLAMGSPRSGVPFAERALSESEDNPQLRVRSLRALGTVLTWLGDGHRAVTSHQDALNICHRYGLYARIPIAYHDLGDAHRMTGNGVAAGQAYDIALHNASKLSLGHTRELVRVKQVMCRLTDGETDGVVEDLKILAPIALRSGLGLAVPFCRLLEAWSWCIDGDLDQCSTVLSRIDNLRVIAVDPQIPYIIESIAEALKVQPDPLQAAQLFSVAAELWVRQENRESAERCQRARDILLDNSD